MLLLEAELGTAPSVLAILGTRTATYDPKPFYRGRQSVIQRLRRRYGRGVEYSSLCEFTTGDGLRSGGLRRPHWNLFLKGVPVDDLARARGLVRESWCGVVDADAAAQYVEELRNPRGAALYVALHFQKKGQEPPAGWSGQRFNSSRGFFDGRTRAQMRELAHLEMRRQRVGHLIGRALGMPPDSSWVRELVQTALVQQAGREWGVVKTSPQRAELLLAMDPETGEILKRARHPPDRARVAPDKR